VSDISLWLALAACLLSGYFGACNIALKTFSRARLSELLEDLGQAQRFEPFVQRKSRLILLTGTVRICLSLVVLLLVLSFFERRFPQADRPTQYLLALCVAGLAVSVFAVAIPVSIARYHRERLLARSIPFLNVCLMLFWPVVWAMNLLDPVIRRITGGDTLARGDSHLSDEILSVVEEHNDNGAVDERQKEMLEAVVEFPTTEVSQIMSPRTDVQGIDIQSTLEEVRAAILRDGHSRIPVYQESLDHIVGILYTKDLIQFIGNDRPFELRKVLRDVMMVPESKPVRELFAEFKARKVHIAIVLDEYGGTAGLVTIEDIIEEIVGEIQDEYEPVEDGPLIRRMDENTVEVDARVYIDDLNDELDAQLPEDKDYDTVGGFVFATLGHIPEVGERFEFDDIHFTVTAAERTKVSRVRLERVQPQAVARNGKDIAD